MLAAGISTQRVIRPVLDLGGDRQRPGGGQPGVDHAASSPRSSRSRTTTTAPRTVNVASRYDANGILIHGHEADRERRRSSASTPRSPSRSSARCTSSSPSRRRTSRNPTGRRHSAAAGCSAAPSIEPPFAGEPNEKAVLVEAQGRQRLPPAVGRSRRTRRRDLLPQDHADLRGRHPAPPVVPVRPDLRPDPRPHRPRQRTGEDGHRRLPPQPDPPPAAVASTCCS